MALGAPSVAMTFFAMVVSLLSCCSRERHLAPSHSMSYGTRVVHLVRHGEVANPQRVIYGRLPGFVLSVRGRTEAEQAARRLQEREVGAIYASPLERTVETATIIAAPHE